MVYLSFAMSEPGSSLPGNPNPNQIRLRKKSSEMLDSGNDSGGAAADGRRQDVDTTSTRRRHDVLSTSCRRSVDVASTSCRRPSAAAPAESCPESSISLDFCEGGSGWGSGSRGGNSQVLTLRQASEDQYPISLPKFLRKVDFVLVFTSLLQCQNLGVPWGNWMGRRLPMRGFAGSDIAKGK